MEINEISLPVPKLILSTDHTDGKILLVSLDPADASTQLLKVTLKDDSVVSWSTVAEGILFKPKKIGSTQVTIGAKSGPAASVKATVQVVSPEDYADVEIQTIALTGVESGNELSLNLADEAGKTIGVTLDPKEASLDMLKISAAPTGIAVVASLVWCKTPSTPENSAANRTYATTLPTSTGFVEPEISTASLSAKRNSTRIVMAPQTMS